MSEHKKHRDETGQISEKELDDVSGGGFGAQNTYSGLTTVNEGTLSTATDDQPSVASREETTEEQAASRPGVGILKSTDGGQTW